MADITVSLTGISIEGGRWEVPRSGSVPLVAPGLHLTGLMTVRLLPTGAQADGRSSLTDMPVLAAQCSESGPVMAKDDGECDS